MRSPSKLPLFATLLWTPVAFGSFSESEPNSTVAASTTMVCTSTLSDGTCVSQIELETNITGQPDDTAQDDPSLAKPLPLNDEIVGQLKSTRDYDWYYVDVSDTRHPVTPIYFGCDQKQGYYEETAPGSTLSIDPAKDISYQVNYYYQDTSVPGSNPERQSSYVVGPESCKIGTAETIGHFRFQMNTQRAGRYYVRIYGRHIDVKEVDTKVKDTKGVDQTLKSFYDEIVTPTGDYSLRVYTDRVTGEQEPNDGSIEAFPLVSGSTFSGQLATMYDHDWFYIDNDINVNTSKKIPFYFTCTAQAGVYNIAAYNHLGVQQTSYQVQASQCSKASGFSFTLNTPVSARYYFEISPPTFSDTSTFSQADYTVLAIASPNSPVSGTPIRLPGEMEPNENLVNAYPLTSQQAIVGAQISSVQDLDYYYFDNNLATNPGGTMPVYFQCTAPTGSGTVYTLTTFNPLGTLQKSYSVSADQCNVPGGFTFTMTTPSTARYYVLVAEPTGNFSAADYSLSTSYILSTTDAAGKLTTAGVTNFLTPLGKDKFTARIAKCGTKKGVVNVTGKKLNLTGIDSNTQVQVKIGSWSCISGPAPLSDGGSNSTKKAYVFPAPPVAPSPPAPTPSGGGISN